MKCLATALLLLGSANASMQEVAGASELSHQMATSLSDRFNNMDPRVIVQPEPNMPETNKDVTHLTLESSGGAFDEGFYFNTTRIEKGVQYYKYMWKHACAFTKWTPSNQWLHA